MGRFPEVCRSYVAYLSERIRFLSGKIDALTAGSAERKVADYVSSHRQKTQFMSISDLAEEAGVAEATISASAAGWAIRVQRL